MVSGTWAQDSSPAVTLAGQRDGTAPLQYVHRFRAACMHARQLAHLGQR